jgi:hypothetical protein
MATIIKAAIAAIGLSIVCATAVAKPVSFSDSWMFMHERDRNLIETQLYYSPTHWFSIGPSTTLMKSDTKLLQMESTFLQVNFLAKRWNLSNAQGNIFTSYGVGKTKISEAYVVTPNGPAGHAGHGFGAPVEASLEKRQYTERSQRLGLQGDYETRQIYTSVRFDLMRTENFLDRIQTFQAGFSPVAHDYDDIAVWFIGQIKKYQGMHDKTESGAFLRVFKRNIWLELGVMERKKSQMMVMLTY